MSGAQNTPEKPGTKLVVQAGGLAKTGGPGDQKTLSGEDLEAMPWSV
jgi:hypothetical protein